MGILRFYKNVCRMLDFWFGNGESDETVDIISEYIIESGNWGNYESRVFADGARNSMDSESAKGSKLKFFIKAAFPPAEYIRVRYPVLEKMPFLLPVIWPVRWMDALIFRRKNFVSNVKKLEMINDENAGIYRDKFKKSGFDF